MRNGGVHVSHVLPLSPHIVVQDLLGDVQELYDDLRLLPFQQFFLLESEEFDHEEVEFFLKALLLLLHLLDDQLQFVHLLTFSDLLVECEDARPEHSFINSKQFSKRATVWSF